MGASEISASGEADDLASLWGLPKSHSRAAWKGGLGSPFSVFGPTYELPVDRGEEVETRPFMPELTIYLVSVARVPLVFTSLWRNHRELLAALRERHGDPK